MHCAPPGSVCVPGTPPLQVELAMVEGIPKRFPLDDEVTAELACKLTFASPLVYAVARTRKSVIPATEYCCAVSVPEVVPTLVKLKPPSLASSIVSGAEKVPVIVTATVPMFGCNFIQTQLAATEQLLDVAKIAPPKGFESDAVWLSTRPLPNSASRRNKIVRVIVRERGTTPSETSRKRRAFSVDSIGCCRLESVGL